MRKGSTLFKRQVDNGAQRTTALHREEALVQSVKPPSYLRVAVAFAVRGYSSHMETEVFIVTASGPNPHKASGDGMYFLEEEAQEEADRRNLEGPGVFTVYRMLIRPAPLSAPHGCGLVGHSRN